MSQDILRRNNVTIKGNGQQIMLFAHEFGCDQNMWRFVTSNLRKIIILFFLIMSDVANRVLKHTMLSVIPAWTDMHRIY